MGDSRDRPRPLRVIKLGGSLLPVSDLARRVANWLHNQSFAQNIWIVGGGELVDTLRKRDRIEPLDPLEAHWKSINSMDVNSQRLAKYFPSWQIVRTISCQTGRAATHNQILITSHWIRKYANDLPASWDVTSDSIAATIAAHQAADELVLLKSADGPTGGSIATAIHSGFVDRFFNQAVAPGKTTTRRRLKIRAVNLRRESFPEIELCNNLTDD